MADGSATVDRVLRGELCSGCGLCASVSSGALRMESLAPGYNRPVTTGSCRVSPEAEAVIGLACPGSVIAPWPDLSTTDVYWGPIRKVMTGFAVDENVRFEGSSGGAISALLIFALQSGQVDRVLHIAADPAHPTRNLVVVSRTADEIVERAGSRYTASSPLAEIESALAEGGKFAFVGKPCDASALRQLAKSDPRVAACVPLILSFFCGGIPSHDGVGRILSSLGLELREVSTFRYRGRGWPGNASMTTGSGQSYEMSYARSWGGYLSKEVQFRCKICPDAVGGVADITCADAWYGDESGYPNFEEQDGRSLIVARTAAGERLLNSALAAQAVAAEPLNIGEIIKMQPFQAQRKRLVLSRVASLPLTLQPFPTMTGLKVFAAAQHAGLAKSFKNFLGTARRTFLGRRSKL